jgi:hypothetical protein
MRRERTSFYGMMAADERSEFWRLFGDTETAAFWPGLPQCSQKSPLIRGRSLLKRTGLNKVDFDTAIEAGGEVVFDRVAPEQDRHVQAEWIGGALSLARQTITIKNAVIAGTLVLSELDIEPSLRFFSCSFDRIDAGGATFQKTLALQDCTVSAGASFTGCEFRRGISLINSKIKGATVAC